VIELEPANINPPARIAMRWRPLGGSHLRADKETNTVANARTNDEGSYTIPYLVPGTYDLSADFTGIKKNTHVYTFQVRNRWGLGRLSSWT
jgi:hypothetical protein